MQTLNDFFNTQPDSLEWANNITAQEGFSQAKPVMARELAGIQLPPAFYEALIMQLCSALDLEIGNLMVGGYRKHREIISYRDRENPAEGYHKATLLEHTLTSKHAPTIQPVVNQVPLARLTFDIVLKLTLKGGKLFIRDGAITQVSTGDAIGSGAIEFKGIKILEKETTPYTLPGTLWFDPPIPI